MNFCSECGAKAEDGGKYCSFCGKPLAMTMQPINSMCLEPEDSDARSVESVWKELNEDKVIHEFKNKEWYYTKWIWFWLIIFFPVGIYGLRKRKGFSIPKWLIVIVASYIIFYIYIVVVKPEPSAQISIAPFTKGQVCKGIIASATGKPVNIMKAIVNRQFVQVSYRRPDDDKRWVYRCKLEGNKGIWAMGDGRWRTNSMDSKITFQVVNTALYIKQIHGDGSIGQKIFGRSNF